jgi:hypothetical protein
VIPLAGDGSRYRLHHLVRDMLLAELTSRESEHPSSTAGRVSPGGRRGQPEAA